MSIRITLDRSVSSVVVCCSACPWWRALTLSVEDADVSGSRHEEIHHPETWAFRRNAMRRAQRHAEHSSVGQRSPEH